METPLFKFVLVISFIGLLLLFAVLGYGGYRYYNKQEARFADFEKKISLQGELTASTTASLSKSIHLIEESLSLTESGNKELNNSISLERQRTASLQQNLEELSGTVGTLDKLSKTDPELLQKYSKVFFLNEHYVPSNLSEIPKNYLYSENTPQKLHASVLPHLIQLLNDATQSPTTIYVKSGYRSFYDQVSLKSAYSVTYGVGTANKFSAEQGYSEHQLGTTVDFITAGLGGQLTGFDKTPTFKWLVENAYKYGFILSYPKNNAYYMYEPWHWRYVGVPLATKLHNEGTNFYDVDQRIIDEYLVSIFD